jgi:hypothetical protein
VSRRGRNDNIKIYLPEISYESGDLMELAQDRFHLRGLSAYLMMMHLHVS